MKLRKGICAAASLLLLMNHGIYTIGNVRAEAEMTAKEGIQSEQLLPHYAVGDCYLRAGEGLGTLALPKTATGVNGEAIPGKVVWSPMPTFDFIFENDMPMSGADGEILELYWMFVPDEIVTGYGPVSGTARIIFGAKPSGTYDKLAEEVLDRIHVGSGGMSQGSSVSGSMAGSDTLLIVGDLHGANHTFEKEALPVKDPGRTEAAGTVKPGKSTSGTSEFEETPGNGGGSQSVFGGRQSDEASDGWYQTSADSAVETSETKAISSNNLGDTLSEGEDGIYFLKLDRKIAENVRLAAAAVPMVATAVFHLPQCRW